MRPRRRSGVGVRPLRLQLQLRSGGDADHLSKMFQSGRGRLDLKRDSRVRPGPGTATVGLSRARDWLQLEIQWRRHAAALPPVPDARQRSNLNRDRDRLGPGPFNLNDHRVRRGRPGSRPGRRFMMTK